MVLFEKYRNQHISEVLSGHHFCDLHTVDLSVKLYLLQALVLQALQALVLQAQAQAQPQAQPKPQPQPQPQAPQSDLQPPQPPLQ